MKYLVYLLSILSINSYGWQRIGIYFNQEWVIGYIPDSKEESYVAQVHSAFPFALTNNQYVSGVAYVFPNDLNVTLSSKAIKQLFPEYQKRAIAVNIESTLRPILLGVEPLINFRIDYQGRSQICYNHSFKGGCTHQNCHLLHIPNSETKDRIVCLKGVKGNCRNNGCNRRHLSDDESEYLLQFIQSGVQVSAVICNERHENNNDCPFLHLNPANKPK